MNVSAVLESWEGGIQQSSRTLRAWLNRNKWVLGGALLLAMGLYYPIFQQGLENIDSFCTAEPYWGGPVGEDPVLGNHAGPLGAAVE